MIDRILYKYTQWALICVYMVIACAGVAWASQAAPYPVFDNVDRVIIVVDTFVTSEGYTNDELPAPLQKASIENAMKRIYTERYKSTDYVEQPGPWGYNRKNQPILVMSSRDIRDNPDIFRKSGTLLAYANYRILEGKHLSPVSELDLCVLNISHFRTGMDIPALFRSRSIPTAFPITDDEAYIENNIKSYIESLIR